MPDKGHEAADKELKRLEKELTKHYKQAAAELTKKAEAFMRDFERKDAQMKKLVDAGKMTEQDYMNWRRNQAMTNERIQAMKDTLAKDLAHADQIAAGMIDATLPSAYAENFNFGTYEIETGTTIDTGFTLYDKKTVENLMKKDPDIIPQLTEKQKAKIPEDERWNRKKLTSAIAQGILQGESVPAIATRLQSVAMMDRNAAIRNARTYTTAAENKGRVDSIARANDMGIPADQEWIATLDDRTRMEHRHLDGQVRPVGEYFETDGYRILYPGDPHAEPEMIYNCRCTLVSKVKGRIYNDERNDEKLNGMSYEEWKHARDRELPKEEPKSQEPKILGGYKTGESVKYTFAGGKSGEGTILDFYEGRENTRVLVETENGNEAWMTINRIEKIEENKEENQVEEKDIEQMYEGTGIDIEEAKQAIQDWIDGESYEYRYSQQHGYQDDGADYIEELIEKSNVHHEGSPIYRGIMVEEEYIDDLMDKIEYESDELIDMLGTSSWTKDENLAEKIAAGKSELLAPGMDEGGVPLVFEVQDVPKNNVLLDIGGDFDEVIMSKDSALTIGGLYEKDGVYHAVLIFGGREKWHR